MITNKEMKQKIRSKKVIKADDINIINIKKDIKINEDETFEDIL